MQAPLELSYKGCDRTERVDAAVREHVARLESIVDDITTCHVTIEAPHRSRTSGNAFEVRIEARVPGTELVVSNKPGDVLAHDNVMVAVRDAFHAMERRLKRWKRAMRMPPRSRELPLQGRVSAMNPDEQYGRIATTDGRSVYFHGNSVVGGTFHDLEEGDAVELVVRTRESEKGPQASTVRRISELRYESKRT